MAQSVRELLQRYQPQGAAETGDLDRIRELVATAPDPWLRSTPLHLTASALIVHPDTGRVLLRWHQRQQAWLHVGGHGDPGECDPVVVALREGHEETGLSDLMPWPDAALCHAVIVPVPAGRGEVAHEHADLRFFLATRKPDDARAENDNAPVQWLTVADAMRATDEANLRECIHRLQQLLMSRKP